MIVVGIDPGVQNWGFFFVGEGAVFGGLGPQIDWRGERPAAVATLRTWLQQMLLSHTDWPAAKVILGIERQSVGRRNVLRVETAMLVLADVFGLEPRLIHSRTKKGDRHAEIPESWRAVIDADYPNTGEQQHVLDAAWVAKATAEAQGVLEKMK